MNFVIGQIDDVEMILSQTLEMTEVSLTYGVATSEGRTLELARADLGDVMGQLAPYCLL